MRKKIVTFRLDEDKKKAVDIIAEGLDRDRSYVLNEAVDSYIDIHRWQVEHIKEGLRQAKAGNFATKSEVAAAFAKLRKTRSR